MINGDYILVKAPLDYPGYHQRGKYCYEHQLVYWKETGIIARRGEEVIHHKNGDKHDNRFENLSLEALGHHCHIHSAPVTMRQYVCLHCKKEFSHPARGRVYKFCSRRCIGLYNYPKKKALL